MNNKYEELDSLRGLAAISVLFSHMLLIFKESFISKLLFEYGPLRIMVAGSEAVTLFFVLSGFVLSLPFYSSKYNFSYSSYLIKRICRIYIPYITAIIVAILFMKIFYSGKIEGLSEWFNANWSSSLNIKTIYEHTLLVGTFLSNINNVVWSLVHEMRISFVFPFIMFIIVKITFKKQIGLAILFSSISVLYYQLSDATYWGTEFFVSLHYSAIFILGAIIAKYRNKVINLMSNLNFKRKSYLLFIGLFLFLYAHPSFILHIFINDFSPFYRTVLDSWVTAIGAGILIIFSISSKTVSKLLRNNLINYIGKISYSLYLCHLTVLFSCLHLLYNILPTWFICIIVLLLSISLSSLLYHFIEKPAIKLARVIVQKISKNISNNFNNPIKKIS